MQAFFVRVILDSIYCNNVAIVNYICNYIALVNK